jgi:hypothetical protein
MLAAPQWAGAKPGLRVHGERAPAGAAVEVRDAASHAALGSTRADKRGHFRPHVSMATPPTAVEALLAAGEMEWTAGPVPVSIDRDDDDDDEDEDEVKGPKENDRSDDE